MGDLDRAFGQTLAAAPDLINSPGLAVATQGDPGTGEVLAQAQTVAVTSRAVAEQGQSHGNGWFHALGHTLGHVVGDAKDWSLKGLDALNKPLHEVQHDYRYLQDVYTHHGFFAGAAETLAVLGVGAAATALSGGNLSAGALAASATASGLAHIAFKDSYDRSATSNVSFGRDVANLVQLHDTNHGWGKILSGSLDASFDLGLDPLLKLGALSAARKSAVGFTRLPAYRKAIQAGRTTSLTDFVDKYAPGTYISSADSVQRAYDAYAPVRRVVADLGRPEMDAGRIVGKYGKELEGLAPQLGQATTEADALNVFKRAANDKAWLEAMTSGIMPSRSLLRASINATERANFYSGPGARMVKTFTGYLPYTIDPQTLKLSKTTFSPGVDGQMSSAGLVGIYRSLRFSLDHQSAVKWTNDFAMATTVAERKAIYSQSLMEMYKAAGIPDDANLVSHVNSLIKGKVAGAADNEAYGRGYKLGDAVSYVEHGEGTDSLAIHPFQTGDWSFPDYWQLKNSIRDMGAVSKIYGRVDDFFANHYTNTFFKPLALLNAGFGMRVAFAEAIPAALRYGTLNMARAAVDTAAAKERYRVANNIEKDGILAAAGRALDPKGLTKGVISSLSDPNSEDAQLAMRLVIRGDGQTVRGIAQTGHNDYATPDLPTEKAKATIQALSQHKNMNLRMPNKNDYISLNRDADKYQDYWLDGLQKRTTSPAARLIAGDLQDSVASGSSLDQAWDVAVKKERSRIEDLEGDPKDPYAHERGTLARYVVQEPQEFATHRVDDVLNNIAGADGTFHHELADQLRNGIKPTREQLDAIDVTQRPGAVIGHPDVPYLGNNLFQRIVSEGFTRVVYPWINHISREPMFFNATKIHMQGLKQAVDSGILTDDQALTLAMYRGTLDMLPQIHNVALRSQAAAMARNFLPFYFAQEQAVKRVGHLVRTSPNAFRGLQLVEHGMHDPGFIHTDDQGNRHLMLPLVGEMGKGVVNGLAGMGIPLVGGLPFAVSGNMHSLKTVIPEANMPGFSPIGAVPLKLIADMFPEWTPAVTKIIGETSMESSFKDSLLLPNNTIRNLVKGMTADEQDKAFATAFASAIATAAYHGKMPGPDATPEEQQAFIDRVKNNTRSGFFLKALLASFSPLAPKVNVEDPGFRDEFYALTKKYDYPTAVHKFLQHHGDKAISYTIAKSESNAGANIPGTAKAMDWINANSSLTRSKDTSVGASFLVPQAPGATDPAVYNEQLAMHLRERRTPEQFRNQLYIQQGDKEFFDAFAAHKQALEQLAGDDTAQQAENDNFNTFVSQLQIRNRIWANDFYNQDGENLAKQALSQLQVIFAKGLAPAGEQTTLTAGLLDAYRTHQEALASLSDSSLAHERALERTNWTAFLKQRAAEQPLLAPIIRSVFNKLERHG